MRFEVFFLPSEGRIRRVWEIVVDIDIVMQMIAFHSVNLEL